MASPILTLWTKSTPGPGVSLVCQPLSLHLPQLTPPLGPSQPGLLALLFIAFPTSGPLHRPACYNATAKVLWVSSKPREIALFL